MGDELRSNARNLVLGVLLVAAALGFGMDVLVVLQYRWQQVHLASIAALGTFAVLSRMDVDSDAVITIRTVLLFGGAALPLAMPFGLIDLGREHAREMHGGL